MTAKRKPRYVVGEVREPRVAEGDLETFEKMDGPFVAVRGCDTPIYAVVDGQIVERRMRDAQYVMREVDPALGRELDRIDEVIARLEETKQAAIKARANMILAALPRLKVPTPPPLKERTRRP